MAIEFTCKACGRELDQAPAPGTPCPTCGEELVPDAPLEVDPEWTAAREAKQAAAAAPPPKAKLGGVILAVTMIVMIGVLVVMITQRQPTAKGAKVPSGVELTITAPRPTPFTIDGVTSGKTPQVIKLRGRTKPLRIEGNGVVRDINPDHDQIVNLAPDR